MNNVILSNNEIKDIYRKRAKRYDFTANLYYLIGFREWAVRKKAIKGLNLKPGDTVVEIGCGTGLNFSLLQESIGPGGKIIGVDLTDAMLAQARKRVADKGWSNVELVQSDAAEYRFPESVNSILSTFAITLAPEYDAIIHNGAQALALGGRWVVADFKMSDGWLARRFVPFLLLVTHPFGVRLEMADRHPWESIEKHLGNVSLKELFLGFAYIASGEKK